MNKVCINHFQEARNLAWESKITQLSILPPSIYQVAGTKAFNKEFRTLHLDFGRQTGNTTFIIKKCCDLSLNGTSSCFCFFFSYQVASSFWISMRREVEVQRESSRGSADVVNIFTKRMGVKIQKKHITTSINTYTFNTMEHNMKYIPNSYAFVDISCMMGEKKLDKIMESNQWEIICLL